MVIVWNLSNPQLTLLCDVDILSYAGVQLTLDETFLFDTGDPCVDFHTALDLWRFWVFAKMHREDKAWIPYSWQLKLENVHRFCLLSDGAYWLDDLELKFRGW